MSALLRGIWSLDRSYVFAIFSLIAAAVASAYLSFAHIFVDELSDGSTISYTAVEYYGDQFIALLVLPLIITAGPLLVLPRQKQTVRRNHRVNSVVTSIVLAVFTLLGFFSTGIYYLPALIFSTASSISLFFGKDRKDGTRQSGSDDVRLSGRTRKERRAERREKITGPGGGRRRRRNR